MPTDKPSVTVYLEPGLKEKLEEWQTSHGERSLSSAVNSVLAAYLFGGDIEARLTKLEGKVAILEEQRRYSTGTDKVSYRLKSKNPTSAVVTQDIGEEETYSQGEALVRAGYDKNPNNFKRDNDIEPGPWLVERGWCPVGRRWIYKGSQDAEP